MSYSPSFPAPAQTLFQTLGNYTDQQVAAVVKTSDHLSDPNNSGKKIYQSFIGALNPNGDSTPYGGARPWQIALSSVGDYGTDNGAGNIFHQHIYAVNLGSRPTVGYFALTRGKNVWGANFGAYASVASASAVGLEIDFGVDTASVVGGAVGLSLVAEATAGAAANPLHYIDTAMGNAPDGQTQAPKYGWRVKYNTADSLEPLRADGEIIHADVITTAYGVQLTSAIFTGAAAYLPVNSGSTTASTGLAIRGRGGFANAGRHIRMDAEASSAPLHGIEFSDTAGGVAVQSTGSLIKAPVTAARALDLRSGTFANGGIDMGDGNAIVFGATTGGKIGGSTSSKIAFYNGTPGIQPSSTGTSAGFTAGAGTTATHLSTFTGNLGATAYTVGDIVRHLKTLGLIAA